MFGSNQSQSRDLNREERSAMNPLKQDNCNTTSTTYYAARAPLLTACQPGSGMQRPLFSANQTSCETQNDRTSKTSIVGTDTLNLEY
jgi:hypothetical protein